MIDLRCAMILLLMGTTTFEVRGQTQTEASTLGVGVKSKVAPAVVKIETGSEFGTGFFIRPEGWILTNYHVVKDAPIDLATCLPFVRLTYGVVTADGRISPKNDDPLWATVYRVDRRADLALLLLRSMPQGMKTVPFIPVATQTPPEGESCFAIGMPLAGMKWDLRNGIISSQGLYPDDVITALDTKVQPSPERRKTLQRALAPEGSLRIIITTCGINPGDSGGPILNATGELIAVTKAIPKSNQEGISFDKFSYHIHLNEVQEFIKTLPQTPEVLPPYSKPKSTNPTTLESKASQALIYEFADLAENKVTSFIDIDHSSSALSDSQKKTAFEGNETECWKMLGIEWAILKEGNKPTVHYFDLDQNGDFEIVFANPIDDGDEPRRYVREGKTWKLELCDRSYFSTLKFSTALTQSKFEALLNTLPPQYTK